MLAMGDSPCFENNARTTSTLCSINGPASARFDPLAIQVSTKFEHDGMDTVSSILVMRFAPRTTVASRTAVSAPALPSRLVSRGSCMSGRLPNKVVWLNEP